MATMAQANRALKMLPEAAKDAAQKVMDVTAFQVARLAASRARRRTGLLQGSIDWESRPRSTSAVVGVRNPLAFYWKFLEYGTVKMPPSPMFRPAAESQRGEHAGRLEQALRKAERDLERLAP